MAKLSRRIAVMVGVGLALVPLLLFAYLGLYNRLLMDDYIYLGLARDIGTWKAMQILRELWNGDYSNFLLYGLLAPLGESVPSLFSFFLCVSIFVGFGWLSNTLLACLRICAHRRAIVVASASLATAATINGFYNAQVFYWFTGAVEYTWPAVMLLLGIALATEMARRIRGRVQLPIAALAIAFYAFINAGFSEMYLVFQLSAVALIAFIAFVFHIDPKRKSYVVLAIAGLMGTVASLPVQTSSPGFIYRNSQPDYFGYPTFPARDLPNLMDRALDAMLEYMGHEASFTGFMLVVSAGLFFTLSVPPPPHDSKPWKTSNAYAPIIFALVVQLLFISVLWSHQSDKLQVLGRFSYPFMVVVCINLFAILLLLAQLWRRDLFDTALNKHNGLMIYCGCILLLVCLCFVLTQPRSIHYKASSYLYVTAVSLLILLAGQLAFNANEPRLKAVFLLTAFATASAVITLAALLAVKLYGLGLIVERTMTAATFAQMLAGLMNGVVLGALIRRGFCMTDAKTVWLRWIRLFCLLVALTIAAGMVIGHAQRINHARQFAESWDATHQEIIRLRGAGDQALYTKKFLRLRHEHLDSIPYRYKNLPLQWEPMIYYGLEDGLETVSKCHCSDEVMVRGHKPSSFCIYVLCLENDKSTRG